jgi:hypothetical protein
VSEKLEEKENFSQKNKSRRKKIMKGYKGKCNVETPKIQLNLIRSIQMCFPVNWEMKNKLEDVERWNKGGWGGNSV